MHGRQSTYVRGCRCRPCKDAHNEYNKAHRGKPSLAAYKRQLERKKERTPEQWLRDFEFLDVSQPDETIGWILRDQEEDMDWIRRQLESGQTIWASQCPSKGGDVKPELHLEAHIEQKMQSSDTFRKNVLRWKGVIA